MKKLPATATQEGVKLKEVCQSSLPSLAARELTARFLQTKKSPRAFVPEPKHSPSARARCQARSKGQFFLLAVSGDIKISVTLFSGALPSAWAARMAPPLGRPR